MVVIVEVFGQPRLDPSPVDNALNANKIALIQSLLRHFGLVLRLDGESELFHVFERDLLGLVEVLLLPLVFLAEELPERFLALFTKKMKSMGFFRFLKAKSAFSVDSRQFYKLCVVLVEGLSLLGSDVPEVLRRTPCPNLSRN